ncbi:MAG: hypothetical protein JW878_01495 [Methanomicrobia archaeon]|nr:hypothetical protein [Methanomicrobia archaeon]
MKYVEVKVSMMLATLMVLVTTIWRNMNMIRNITGYFEVAIRVGSWLLSS